MTKAPLISHRALFTALLSWISCMKGEAFSVVRSGGFKQRMPWSSQRLTATLQQLSSHRAASLLMDLPLEVARLVQPSVALVTPVGVRNMTTRGSGFVIEYDSTADDTDSYTHLLTAAHVAAPGYKLEVSIADMILPATVVGRNESLDLALIRIVIPATAAAAKPPPPLDIAKTVPPVGSYAFAHGFPAIRLRDGQPAMTFGIVSAIADGLGMPDSDRRRQDSSNSSAYDNDDTRSSTIFSPTTSFVVTDAALSGGMSGGPLVLANGTVIGVNALIRPDLRALGNYAVSCEEIQIFLQQTTIRCANVENGNDDDAAAATTESSSSSFQVMLYNDPMNKRARVSRVLQDIAKLNETEANRVMMEAHTRGKSSVRLFGTREAADALCQSLQQEGDVLVEVHPAGSTHDII